MSSFQDRFNAKCPPATWSREINGGDSVNIPIEAVEFITHREKVLAFIESELTTVLSGIEGLKQPETYVNSDEGCAAYNTALEDAKELLRQHFGLTNHS